MLRRKVVKETASDDAREYTPEGMSLFSIKFNKPFTQSSTCMG
jgi:hypothetical protein